MRDKDVPSCKTQKDQQFHEQYEDVHHHVESKLHVPSSLGAIWLEHLITFLI